MSYLFSNEIVFVGHPDKVADQISDALLDSYMLRDPYCRAGIEVVGGKGKIFLTGEVSSTASINKPNIVRAVLNEVGYNDKYEIIDNIGVQSPDIAIGVDEGGAGDQGMMFGFACRDTERYIPTAMAILQDLSHFYDKLRQCDERFLPDGKAQITGLYDKGTLIAIKDFVVSYQNTEKNRADTDKIIIDACNSIAAKYGIVVQNYYINPTGKFLIGGFDGDSGLTGRKIVVDNYHSFANVGGGAFSGKDPTKVDRSGAYKARQIAIRWLKEHKNDYSCEVQLSYAIGIAEPMAIYLKAYGGNNDVSGCTTYDLTQQYKEECKPISIIRDLKLRDTNVVSYYKTAKFGHFGIKGFMWEE